MENLQFKLIDFTDDFSSGIGSLRVGKYIDALILKNPLKKIVISMEGIPNVSPSFINGAFLYIIDLYGEDYFRNYIKIVGISTRLLPIIKDAINNHIEKKKEFFNTLNTNSIFVGIDGSLESMRIRKDLFNNVHQKVKFLWNRNEQNMVDEQTKQNIQNAMAFIGIWIEKDQNNQSSILEQANYAISIRKPCIIFCSKEVYIKVPEAIKNKVQLMRFDESTKFIQERNLNEIILNNQVYANPTLQNTNKGSKDALEMAAWGLLGVVGIWALTELLSDNKK